ncbi:putative butyrophilin-like protein 10 isoform X1 [Dipodomys merriami]|uniref:putative butyrophilin-like protein 10 isoform X1 n=1 Tax=Dipodomys merriami TaxID=94247 RepID=UPI0038556872
MAKPARGDGSLPGFVMLLFLQMLPTGHGKADFYVLAPQDPLLAIVGEDTELPCSLAPSISAQGMELRWYREQPTPAVHVRVSGRDAQEEQMVEYRGRTALVSDGLDRGVAAVRIYNVTTFDNGTYHCLFKEHTSYSRATLWLKVAGLGTAPQIQVIDKQDQGIWATCSSAGWYPEPRVEWRDLRGQTLPAVTHVSVSASTGLFGVVSSVAPQDRATDGLTCSISNPLLSESKVAARRLPSPFSRYLFMEWRLALPLTCISLGLVIAGIVCLFKKRQREHRTWLEEEAEQRAKDQQQGPSPSEAEAEPLHVSPSLDPDTANPKLMVSEDQKSVTRLLFEQDLPPNPHRFDQDPCVLAQERFWAGRYYWEIEVGSRRAWILGVCLESLGREGRIPKSPRHGLWAVEFYRRRFRALSYPRTPLCPPEPFLQVGVLLDCDAGEVAFYNATQASLIYKFSGLSFTGPLRPFFCLWTHDPSPLTLCPVARETQEDTGSPRAGPSLPLGPPGVPSREQHLLTSASSSHSLPSV